MIEHLVTSLDLSCKLKDAGVPQDSYFYWIEDKNKTFITSDTKEWDASCSAYLSDELGLWLPTNFKTEKVDLGHGGKLEWTCWSNQYGEPYEREDTESECRGLMLLYLISHQLLDVKTLK